MNNKLIFFKVGLKALIVALAIALVFGLGVLFNPIKVGVNADEISMEVSPTKSIADGTLSFKTEDSKTYYKQGSGEWTQYTNAFTITGQSINNTEAYNYVVVESGTHNITLDNVHIGAGSRETVFNNPVGDKSHANSVSENPFNVSGNAIVNLTLVGNNHLISANILKAGLRVAENATLSINGTGYLEASCCKIGPDSLTDIAYSAGIGGNKLENAGNITISSASVFAISTGGPGIGGGKGASEYLTASSLTINSGTVRIQTSDSAGVDVYADNIVINGGCVRCATSGSNKYTHFSVVPKNSASLEVYSVVLKALGADLDLSTLTFKQLNENFVYDMTGAKSSDDNNLYVYFPLNKYSTEYNGIYYYATVFNNNCSDFSPNDVIFSINAEECGSIDYEGTINVPYGTLPTSIEGNKITFGDITVTATANSSLDNNPYFYTFNGWGIKATTPINGATRVYANFNKIAKTYTIVFDANGGSEVEQKQYTVETEDFDLTETSKTGYDFVGWFGKKVFGETTYYVGLDYFATGDENLAYTDLNNSSLTKENSIKQFDCSAFAQNGTLIAKWKVVNYQITYINAENGVDNVTNTNPTSYNINSETITLNHPIRFGYRFSGWFNASSMSYSSMSDETISSGSTDAKIFYAKWTAWDNVTLSNVNIDGQSRVCVNDIYYGENFDTATKIVSQITTENMNIFFGAGLDSFSSSEVFTLTDNNKNFVFKRRYIYTGEEQNGMVINNSNCTFVQNYLGNETVITSNILVTGTSNVTFKSVYVCGNLTINKDAVCVVNNLSVANTNSISLYGKLLQTTEKLPDLTKKRINANISAFGDCFEIDLNATEGNGKIEIDVLAQAGRVNVDGYFIKEFKSTQQSTSIITANFNNCVFEGTNASVINLDNSKINASITNSTISAQADKTISVLNGSLTLEDCTVKYTKWNNTDYCDNRMIYSVGADSNVKLIGIIKYIFGKGIKIDAEGYTYNSASDTPTGIVRKIAGAIDNQLYNTSKRIVTYVAQTETDDEYWYYDYGEGETLISGDYDTYFKYKISYYLQGTEDELPIENCPNFQNLEDKQYYIHGIGRTLQELTQSGYTNNGWYSQYDGGTKITAVSALQAGDLKLYWNREAIVYTVTYNENGGDSIDDITYTVESYPTELATPQRQGYTFVGWFVTIIDLLGDTYYFGTDFDNSYNTVFSSLDNAHLTNSISIKSLSGVESDFELIAKWAVDTYTITLNENGGDYIGGYAKPTDYTCGDELTLPTNTQLIKKGYNLAGWTVLSEKFNETTNPYITCVSATDVGDKVFYAKWTLISYTINFDDNDGNSETNKESITYTVDSEATALDNLTGRQGYTFVGWFGYFGSPAKYFGSDFVADNSKIYDNLSNNNLTSSNAFTTIPANTCANLTFIAKWEQSPLVIITLDMQGGINGTSQVFTYKGESMPSAAAPTKDGYEFLGYYLNNDGTGTQYYDSAMNSTNNWTAEETTATLYAVYRDWRVIYVSNSDSSGEGTEESPFNNFGDAMDKFLSYCIGVAGTIKIDGNVFFGNDIRIASFGGKQRFLTLTSKSATSTLNITKIYVKAFASLKIQSLNLIGLDNNNDAITCYDYTKSLELYNVSFKNFYNVMTLNGKLAQPIVIENFKATELRNVYAIYDNTAQRTEASDCNKLIMSGIIDVPINRVCFQVAQTVTVPEGKTLSAPNGEIIQFNKDFQRAKDRMMVDGYVWVENCAEMNLFNSLWNGNDTYALVAEKRADGSGVFDVVARKQAKVSYDLNYDTEQIVPFSKVLNGYKYTSVVGTNGAYANNVLSTTANERAHYELLGWSLTNNGDLLDENSVVALANTNNTNNADFKVYAIWKAKDYSINYQLNNGTNNANNIAKYNIEDETITLADPTRIGYTFSGWTTTEVTTPTKALTIPQGSTGDKTFVANWTANSYAITYTNAVNGKLNVSNTNKLTYTCEDETITLADPTRTGYTFSGWTTTEVTTPTKALTIPQGSTGDKTFVANWTANSYAITYTNAVNGKLNVSNTNTLAYTCEDETIALADPTRTGYTFSGWTTTEVTTPTKALTIPQGSTGDKTFVANWTANTYAITLNEDDGNYVNGYIKPTSYIYGNALTLPTSENIIKIGYTFAGWTVLNSEQNEITNPYITSILSSDFGEKTYYAKWTLNTFTISWKNGDQIVEIDENVGYGTIPTYNGETPIKTSLDATYKWNFKSWSPSVVVASKNATYTANFEKILLIITSPHIDPTYPKDKDKVESEIKLNNGVEEDTVFIVKVKDANLINENIIAPSGQEIVKSYNAQLLKNNVEFTSYTGLMTIKIATPVEVVSRQNVKIVLMDRATGTATIKALNFDGDYLTFQTDSLGDFVIVADEENDYLIYIIVGSVLLLMLILALLFGLKRKIIYIIDSREKTRASYWFNQELTVPIVLADYAWFKDKELKQPFTQEKMKWLSKTIYGKLITSSEKNQKETFALQSIKVNGQKEIKVKIGSLSKKYLDKLNLLNEQQKTDYCAIKNTLHCYASLNNAITQDGDTFKFKNDTVAKISVLKNQLKFFVDLDRNLIDGRFRRYDASKFKKYKTVPLEFTIDRPVEVRKALSTIKRLAKYLNLEKQQAYNKSFKDLTLQ